MAVDTSYGIIILAAGNSSRLGEPKQLLRYQDKSLIKHVADSAIEAITSPVIVVTGSETNRISEELKELSVHFAFNSEWQEGMASSIRIGLQTLIQINPSVNGVILAVSDQPFVTTSLFLDILNLAKNDHASIIACSYENTLGTPVYFKSSYFESLLNLRGAEGAKKLLKQFADQVASIPFPLGGIDIDTQEDYRRLLNSQ